MNVRKSGHIGKSAKRKTNSVSHIDYIHAAEIAARLMEDKHQLTIDRVLCHPGFRQEFDAAALKVTPGISPYLLRKAALSLRKTRRLKPELIKRIVSDSWGRKAFDEPARELENDLNRIPKRPGVYIFYDASGYLYIGEADDLRKRLSKHLDHSDRKTLAHYFWENGLENVRVQIHAFSADSEGSIPSKRRAYEADLIRNRKPKFNIQGRESNP